MKGLVRIATISKCLVAAWILTTVMAPVAVLAREQCHASASLGLTAGVLVGNHESSTSRDAVTSAIPLIDAKGCSGVLGVEIEGSLPIESQSIGLRSLEVLNGVITYKIQSKTEIGVGETVYNMRALRRSGYLDNVSTDEYSRVGGARYFVAQEFASRANPIRLEVAVNPLIRGLYHRDVKYPYAEQSIEIPERGSQVDIALIQSFILRGSEMFYVVRYLHYSARLDDRRRWDYADLADRNVGLLLGIGMRLKR